MTIPDSSDLSDLLISLVQIKDDSYQVNVRFTRAEEETELTTQRAIAVFDTQIRNQLRRTALLPKKHGLILRQAFIENTEPSLTEYLNQCLANAHGRLRLRIEIDPSAKELLDLRWETLFEQEDRFMAVNANQPLSRFLSTSDWSDYELYPREELRALVAVANPKELSDTGGFTIIDAEVGARRNLTPVDVAGEVSRALDALKYIPSTVVLASYPTSQGKATYEQILSQLGEGCDILYLVCHGAIIEKGQAQKPYLLLEKEDGQAFWLDGERLVDSIRNLPVALRPRLVVLASCQSAGLGRVPGEEEEPGREDASQSSDDRGALAALGPRLVTAGLPAVVAMQENVRMKTVEIFMPVFFEHLLNESENDNPEGRVDQAVAWARFRAMESACPDWWVPVLYTRLKEGKLFPQRSPDPLKAYLSIASQRPRFEGKESLKLLNQLWDAPFRARVVEKGNRQTIGMYRLINSLLLRDDARRYNRAVLLGSSGQGKSTAMKSLCAQFAEQALRQLKRRARDPESPAITIPVYVSLNDLRQNGSLENLVLNALNQRRDTGQVQPITMEQLHAWIDKQYTLLFLVDDLEALISYRYGFGLQTITDFMSQPRFQNQRFLIGCRSSSYRNQLGVIYLLELADLEPEDVKKVLGSDFECLSKSMQDLAVNRSLLRLILALPDEQFQTKGQLMKVWVEQQLGLNYDQFDGMDPFLIKTILGELAYEMRSKHQFECDEPRIIEILSGHLESRRESYAWREVINYLRKINALQIEPIQRCYSFVERDFADYFSAAAVIAKPERLQQVLDTASDYWWRDMLELLVGLVDDPASLLYELIDRDAIVAAFCIQFAGIEDPYAPVYSALADGLVEQMDRASSLHRKEIVERIIETEHPRVPEVLLHRLHREWSSTVILAIARGLESWKKSNADIRKLVRMEAKILASFPQERKSVKQWLRMKTPLFQERGASTRVDENQRGLKKLTRILQDESLPAKLRGLAAISLGMTQFNEAGRMLLKLVQDPQADDLVVWCALEALADFPDKQLRKEAYSLYQKYESAEFKGKPRCRARFIYLLGWMKAESGPEGAGDYSESPKIVLEKALKDRHPLVRGYAIQSMVRWNLLTAPEIIANILEKEKDPLVLRDAAQALGQIGTPDSIEPLERKLKSDVARQRQILRSAYRDAIQEIRERYGI